MTKNPILVTGSHRSGTTFTGKVLCFDKTVGYIHEPFNFNGLRGTKKLRIENWFQFVTIENEDAFLNDFKKILEFNFSPIKDLSLKRSFIDTLFLLYHKFNSNSNKLLNKRPLIKDPIAIFSAPWLSERFNMDVVVLIRHPAAFASSIKLLNWTHDFNALLNQPLLMDGILAPFKEEIKSFASKKYPIIEEATLLWKIIYYTVKQYQITYPEWIFIRHEDLSENPIEEFKRIYNRLDLDFTDKIEKKIIRYTNNNHFVDPISHPGTIKRDSRINKEFWRTRLNIQEIDYIKLNVESVSKHFYSEEEW